MLAKRIGFIKTIFSAQFLALVLLGVHSSAATKVATVDSSSTGAATNNNSMNSTSLGIPDAGLHYQRHDHRKLGTFKSLNYLYSISGKATVAGIQNRYSETPDSFTQQAQQVSGRTPGLWGGDFLFDYNEQYRWTMINEAKTQWESGALVNIMWHACNPALSDPCSWDGVCTNGVSNGSGPQSHLSDSQWQELITDGTSLNSRWKQMMDDISQYLMFLQNNGVEVLFRPLHEMNQGCFWWGGRSGSTGTARLYQITHDYLTNVKGLTNLVWVWDLQDFSTLQQDVVGYNPGSQYYDVVALDIYSGYATWKYNVMQSVSAGKPIAIGECDVLPDISLLANEPQWMFFMSWSELTFQKNTNTQISDLYNSAQVITLDEMPGWSASDGVKTFRSWRNTYLSAWSDGTLQQEPHAQAWEQWTVVPYGTAGKVSLRSYFNTYLSGWPDYSVRTASHMQDWESWTIVTNGDGSVSLLSFQDTYLSAWYDGTLVLAAHDQAWEHWSMN